jgi:hypothetical protein
VTFTAVATNGGSSPSYQWKKNGLDVGINSTTYSTSALVTGDVISVVLTSNSPCTSVPSVTASEPPVTVAPVAAPAISINGPSVLALCTGAPYTFTSSHIDGGVTPTYQWYINGTAVPGATGASYTGSGFANNDSVSVLLTSSAPCRLVDTVRSNSVKLTVSPSVVPTVGISSNTGSSICSGTSVTFTAVATNGGSSPSYQWKKNGLNVGTNNTAYTTSALVTGDVISVVLTSNSTCASVLSVTASTSPITVAPAVMPVVSISGASPLILCAGASNTFTATSSNGGVTPTYQWYKNGAAIPGATGASYTGSGFANNDSIAVLLTSSAPCRLVDTIRSSHVKLTIYPNTAPSLIVGSNSGNSICPGTTVVFTAAPINGGSSPSYQWKKNGVNVGTNNAIYSTSALATGDVITVTLTSTSPCATVSSVTASGPPITVAPVVMPAVSISGASTVALCAGASNTFTATTSNGGVTPTYQWYKNGTAIPGAIGASYTGSGFANNDSVSVLLTSSAPCRLVDTVRSNRVKLMVSPVVVPTVVVTANPGTSVPAGTSITFTAIVTASGAVPTYQWYKNGVGITGATGSLYTANTLEVGDLITVGVGHLGLCANPDSLTSAPLQIGAPAGIQVVSGKGSWQESLLVYPNPSSGHITVTADWGAMHAGEQVQVSIVNSLGQPVFSRQTVVMGGRWNLELQLPEGLANGIYMLRLWREKDGSRTTKPLIIQR